MKERMNLIRRDWPEKVIHHTMDIGQHRNQNLFTPERIILVFYTPSAKKAHEKTVKELCWFLEFGSMIVGE